LALEVLASPSGDLVVEIRIDHDALMSGALLLEFTGDSLFDSGEPWREYARDQAVVFVRSDRIAAR
jgi:hypothetical protein